MDWTSFIEKGKVSLRILLSITVLTASLIFLPISLKEKLMIQGFANEYKQYIGPVFLISTVFLIVSVVSGIYKWVRGEIRFIEIKSEVRQDITQLSRFEKSILREFYLTGQDTLPLPITDAAVVALVNKRIIYQAGNHGSVRWGEVSWNYSLTKVAKKYLTPDKMDFPIGTDSAAVKFLTDNRPKFN